MERINIGAFTLELYEDENPRHRELADIFESDEDGFLTYVGPFKELSEMSKKDSASGRYSGVYFAYINGTIVGMVGLIWIHDLPEIIVGILPNHRGHHYSKILNEEYTEYIFKTYHEYTKLYASIMQENTHSIENALRAGFVQIDEFKFVKKK